jgi:hypothetical protein
MGEVYRARETRLERDVAIKVLPDAVAQDPHRKFRFEQEARSLAALNHPHIGAIYGVEETDDLAALVLELVEGPTLAERLARGVPPVDEIIAIARQVAEALEAAHDRGIVHRDLKPANIKISPEGNVKVLDFGLAKALASAPANTVPPPEDTLGARPSLGHPITRPLTTQAGSILGTAAYMSPEQARGQAVDKRTDVWAFGCVLFEMCAGRPAFARRTATDTIASVIAEEPDWALLPQDTAPFVLRLLRRCLTKDPKLRLRDIGEARIALTIGADADGADIVARGPRRLVSFAALAAVLLVGASLGPAVYLRFRGAVDAATIRFLVPPPEGGSFVRHPGRSFFALSPDGSQLAFVAGPEQSRVWIRAVSDFDARVVPGTDGALSVFWSPDARSLAFFADGKLKRVDLGSGTVVPICDVPTFSVAHGTWSAEGVILFGSSQGTAIWRVDAAGGVPRQLLTPIRADGEVRVHWPHFLPGDRRFLYTARRDDGEGELRLAELDGPSRTLMPVTSNTQWVDPNVVVFVREGVLMGQRVDADAGRTVGDPFAIAEGVDYLWTSSRAMFSAARTGTIAYHTGGDLMQPMWVDQRGNELGTIGSPAAYDVQSMRLSPDGGTLLTARRQDGIGTYDIWRRDLVRNTEERLTSDRGSEVAPVLAGDGRTMFFAADRRGGVPNLFRKDLATGIEEPIMENALQQLPMDVTAGEGALVYVQRSKQMTYEIYRVSRESGTSAVPVLESRLDKYEVRVSPDGRAIAFAAIDGTRLDVYVAPLPITTAPIVVASDAGGPPRWSRDSRRVYFHDARGRVMTVPVHTRAPLGAGTPQVLFELKRPATLSDVALDGRLLMLAPTVRAAQRPISVATAAVRPD